MRSMVFGIGLVFVAGAAMAADRGQSSEAAKAVRSFAMPIVAHEAEMDANGCHTAKRKRHSEHCHEPVPIEVPVDTVDAGTVPATEDAGS